MINQPNSKIFFVPQPQKISMGQEWFILPSQGVIGIADHSLYAIACKTKQLFRGYAINISCEGLKDTVSIQFVKGLKPDGYRLVIDKHGIQIEGTSAGAVFYSLQTLRQVVEQSPSGRLPILKIDDWPDFPDRGVCYDVTRGRVPKLEQLKQMAEVLSQYKINQLQLYIEHTFAFRGHPDIGKGSSPLSAEDILELDVYCRERHVELVPSLASFGHLSNVLKHPQYHKLAEDWGIRKYITPDKKVQAWLKNWHVSAFTLSPANPYIYRFLDSLFAEFLPLFSSGRFNACCDETVDLGYGQSYKLCQKLGRGRLYLGHIIKLNEICRKYGKTMMFWGDIIRKYPELISKIPKDVTVLDWGYEYNHNFEAIRDFKKTGMAFYACPSTSGYVSLFPRLPQAMANIAGFAAAGYKYGAKGLLNTDWGDGGHSNFIELTWHGYLFGAEQAWNTKADRQSFTSRFCRLFLKTDDHRMVQSLTELGDISQTHVFPFYQSIWRHIFFANAKTPIFPLGIRGAVISVKNKISTRVIKFDSDFGRQTLRRLDKIRAVFAAHSGQRGEDPLKVLPYWIFAVDTIRHAAKKLLVMGENRNNTAGARRMLVNEMLSLMTRFQQLWLARNRVAEIRITLNAYRKAVQAIRKNRLIAKPVREYPSRLLLSQAMPGAGKLDSLAYPGNRKKLRFKVREFGSSGFNNCFFYDLHNDIFNCAPRDVLVYFVCPFNCPKPMKLDVCLGYDGPIKMWIDAKLVYHDPDGTNPATSDQAIIPFDAKVGNHEVLVAFGSNHGKARGLYLRFKRRDLTSLQLKSGKHGSLPRFLL